MSSIMNPQKALAALAEKPTWLLDELPAGITEDVLRVLDDDGHLEFRPRWNWKQRAFPNLPKSPPRGPWPHGWISPNARPALTVSCNRYSCTMTGRARPSMWADTSQQRVESRPSMSLAGMAARGAPSAAAWMEVKEPLLGPACMSFVSTTTGVDRSYTPGDPDGVGPARDTLLIGGGFVTAGDLVANGICTYDRSAGRWSPLGAGRAGTTVLAVAELPDSNLVAGGYRAVAGGPAVSDIARWDGRTWSALGSGIDGTMVSALVVLPNGDLIAAGRFTSAGGAAVNNIARWDGATWSRLSSGVQGDEYPTVYAMTVMPGGNLIVAGSFTTAGGIPAKNIARWDGASWHALGPGLSAGTVRTLAFMANGDLAAGGDFSQLGGVETSGLAVWDGTVWKPIDPPAGVEFFTIIESIALSPDGGLLVGGWYSPPSSRESRIKCWDGEWHDLGAGISKGGVASIHVSPEGDVFAGGTFSGAGGSVAFNIACWNGSEWSALDSGTDGSVAALIVWPERGVIAGGGFSIIGGVPAAGIASWDGASWSELGAGLHGPAGAGASALAELPNGDLVVGGSFAQAGGIAANNIASWDGAAWSPLGSGTNNTVSVLAVLPNGDIVAGGRFDRAGDVDALRIARWNGTSWSSLGAGLGGEVRALVVMPNGDLIAAGRISWAGAAVVKDIARWDGSQWSALSSGMEGGYPLAVNALAVLPEGALVAAGSFFSAGGTPVMNIARWNGIAWSALGAGVGEDEYHPAHALAVARNGDLIVGGHFGKAGVIPAHHIARWDGSVWSAFGEGLGGGEPAYTTAYTVAAGPDGGVLAGGIFTTAGEHASAYLARWACPICTADLDADGVVDFTDYLAFLNAYEAGAAPADLDADGVVDFTDYLEFLNHYEAGC